MSRLMLILGSVRDNLSRSFKVPWRISRQSPPRLIFLVVAVKVLPFGSAKILNLTGKELSSLTYALRSLPLNEFRLILLTVFVST